MRLPILLVAGFAVLFAALTGTTQAADWLPGGTSTDWNTGTNWNGGVVPNNAGGIITSNTGNIATISANAAGPVTELQVATWYNNGRLDHTAGSLTVTNTGWPYGWLLLSGGSYGTGTYNIANTAATGGVLTGFGTGSGSLSVNGEIRVGAGSWWDHATGVLNINTSATVHTNGSLIAGTNVGDVGTVNIDAGTVTVFGDYTNSAQFGSGGSSATGNLKISGGSFTLNNRLTLGVGTGTSAGGNVGTVTLSGGTLTTDVGHNEDWHAGVNMASGYDTATGGAATVNLNGGTLSTLRVFSETGGTGIKGTSTFNFNGGTLKAQASRGNFLEGLTLANMRNGGAIVDTNGFDVTISQALLHSSIGGDNATDGGLTKNGTGVLLLSNMDNSFTGNIVVNGGTLRANTSRNGYLATTNLGANDSSRSITVNTGATLDLTNGNIFTGAGATAGGLPQLVLKGGTMQSSRFNVLGHVTLNGGTLNQTTTDAGGYEFLGNITVGGSAASTISSSNGKANHIAGGNNVLITVADATSSSAADLIISNPLRNGSGDYAGSGAITKAGAGTLQLTATNTYSGSTTVSAGTLLINGTNDQGTGANAGSYLVAAGATLGGTGTIKLSDTNGGGTGLAITGTLSPGDPATASGIGTLTLDGTSSARSVVSFETGAALAMQINTGTSDRLVITGAAAGDVAFNNNTINFTDLSSNTLPPGQYILISSTSAGTFAGLTVNGAGVVTAGLSIGTGLAAYPSTSLQVVGNNLVLNISGMPDTEPPTIGGTFAPLTLVSGAGGTEIIAARR